MKRTEGGLDPTLTPSQAPGPRADAALSETAVATDTPERAARTHPPSSLAPPGYKLGELLGRGGMGEVLLAEDLRFGRDVAIKRMRSGAPTEDAIARFLREAKIQARLDHPAIVPVHDLGYDAAGRPYFTMKRLAGTTLHGVLAGGTATLQRLLRAYIDVCYAIHLAHERGVIHRDLKPANIMLGDYGEVYVLDWGVARVTDEREAASASGSREGEARDGTQVGAILGTPGYMSPEQLRGDEVTAATDVFALGAILFEILAGEPLHERGVMPASALTGSAASPARRQPDKQLPPELDAICIETLAAASADRPSARALAERVQHYLDGDRDVELRRTRAAAYVATAREALASGDPARRSEAMRAAGYALSLDPDSEAASLVSQIMLEPISRQAEPASLARRLAESDDATFRKQSRIAVAAALSYFLFLPFVLWLGAHDWWVVGGVFALTGVTAVSAGLIRRRRLQVSIGLIANCVALVLLSRVFGPFVLVPGIACGAAISLVAVPTLVERTWLVVGALVTAVVLPIVLEWIGVFEQTWELAGGALVVRPTAIPLEGTAALALLISTNIGLIVVTALFARSLASSQRDAQRRIETQAWHLGQLLPVEPPRPVEQDRCPVAAKP